MMSDKDLFPGGNSIALSNDLPSARVVNHKGVGQAGKEPVYSSLPTAKSGFMTDKIVHRPDDPSTQQSS
jgi:hypothetical protein